MYNPLGVKIPHSLLPGLKAICPGICAGVLTVDRFPKSWSETNGAAFWYEYPGESPVRLVLVRANLDPDQTALTVIHELLHLRLEPENMVTLRRSGGRWRFQHKNLREKARAGRDAIPETAIESMAAALLYQAKKRWQHDYDPGQGVAGLPWSVEPRKAPADVNEWLKRVRWEDVDPSVFVGQALLRGWR